MLDILINSWSAWQPRINGPALCKSCKGGRQDESEVEKPNLRNIPAMQRRRLGPLARVVFHVLGQCVDVSRQEPVIFCSLMGEIQRTQRILTAIASDQPVSPAAFSLSVHNAMSGLWSLIHDVKAPMIAISPGNDGTVAGLLEAAGILQERKYPAVNIVHYEEDYPAFYTPFLKRPKWASSCALALRIVAPEAAEPYTRKLTLDALANRKNCTSSMDPLSLVPLLTGSCDVLEIAEHHTIWRLEYPA